MGSWISANIITLIFGVIGVFGLFFTIYFGLENRKLQRARRRLSWPELLASANDLGSRIKRSVVPDVAFTPGLRGATFANLLVNEIKDDIPVYVGISFWKTNNDSPYELQGFSKIETNKWYIYIPDAIKSFQDKKLLLIDDFAMSGDGLEKIENMLVDKGFKRENIYAVTVATTKVAIDNHKAPRYFWFKTEDSNFYFPWGKAQ